MISALGHGLSAPRRQCLIETLEVPLQTLWRAVCEKRAPPGQDRAWFLSTFCELADEQLEFLYSHSDIRPHLRAGLPTPATALLLLLAPDSRPKLQTAAPAAAADAHGATHYLYTGGEAARVGLAALTAELRAAAGACRHLQRAAARDAEDAVAAASAAARDAAASGGALARAAARNAAGRGRAPGPGP